MRTFQNILDLFHDADYLSAGTKKQGAAIQKRIDALKADQRKLNDLEARYKAIPLTEAVEDWQVVSRQYGNLLIQELKLRQEFSGFYALEAKDRQKAAEDAHVQWLNAQKETMAGLYAMGFTEFSLQGSDIIPRHPAVREWHDRYNELRINPYSSHIETNKGAIQRLESELSNMRMKMLM